MKQAGKLMSQKVMEAALPDGDPKKEKVLSVPRIETGWEDGE